MKWLSVGALSAFLAVGLGAFGAHALKARMSADLLDIYKTGVLYHLIHAVGIALAGVATEKLPAARHTALLFCIGTVLFSGSLYALAFTGIRQLGAITPLGGVCFLTGWAILALAARKAS